MNLNLLNRNMMYWSVHATSQVRNETQYTDNQPKKWLANLDYAYNLACRLMISSASAMKRSTSSCTEGMS